MRGKHEARARAGSHTHSCTWSEACGSHTHSCTWSAECGAVHDVPRAQALTRGALDASGACARSCPPPPLPCTQARAAPRRSAPAALL